MNSAVTTTTSGRGSRQETAHSFGEESLVASFGNSAIFAGLPGPAVAALARTAVRRTFRHNDFVYMQDDEATHLYVIVSGFLKLSYLMEDGSAVIHGILSRGHSFGELGVYENSTYCDMATAAGPMIAACVPISSFHSLSRTYPELPDALSRAIAKRYRSYILLTRDLSLNSLPARLAQALLRLADSIGTLVPFGGDQYRCIGAIVTQTDLGLMARGSRGNVNRALKAWERAGLIALNERCIIILKRRSIEALAFDVDS